MRSRRRVLAFRIAYSILAANFLIPSLLYAVSPGTAIESFARLGTFLGGGEYPWSEESRFWYVLGTGNVATLGFCCVLVLYDPVRFRPVVVPLVFLKGCSVVGFFVAWIDSRYPAFLVASLFDLATCAAFVYFARGAPAGPPT